MKLHCINIGIKLIAYLSITLFGFILKQKFIRHITSMTENQNPTELTSINKTDIIERMTFKNPHINGALIDSSVSIMLNQMIDSLAAKNRIEIRGFGSFHISEKQPRLARNPKTGEKVQIDVRLTPRFKAGRALRNNVDASIGNAE